MHTKLVKRLKEGVRFYLSKLVAGARRYFAAGVALIRAESPEEQATAQKVLAGAIIGGAIIVVAPSIATWLGLSYTSLPTDVVNMINKLILFIRGIGAFVLIAGVIYGGIQLLAKRR
jgi:uncharacterized membrane protein